MSRKSIQKGGQHVNVQVSPRANEILKLLKEKFGARNMSDVIEQLAEQQEPDVAKIATRRVDELEAIKQGQVPKD